MAYGINGYHNPYNPYGMYNQYDGTMSRINYTAPVLNGGVTYVDPYPVNSYPDVYPPKAEEAPAKTADGKDDGKIGFWGAAKNFLKGVGKFFTSPFTDEQGKFSLGKTLKSVALGAAFVAGNVLTGGALTPILLTTGLVAGGVGMVKAGVNIATAQTDAEAEAAWQSMGSSTTTVAASVIGAKSYAKAKGIDTSGFKGTAKAVKATAGDAWTNTKAGMSHVKASVGKLADMTPSEVSAAVKNGYNTAKTTASEAYAAGKAYIKGKYDAVKGESISSTVKAGAEAVKGKVAGAYDSIKDTTFREMFTKVLNLGKDAAKTAKLHAPGAKSQIAALAQNPLTIGVYTNLARQTIKPDFYGLLNTQEQAYFDSLPDDQKQQIIDAYYQAA